MTRHTHHALAIWLAAALAACQPPARQTEPAPAAEPRGDGADARTAAGEPAASPEEAAEEPQATVPADGGGPKPRQNHLAGETSPYLLMHAHNPVDWYPWGPAALEKARREQKLVFLSIGYSSCYWCHVMERESFEDEDVAAYLNEHFVSIKVDREERPDLDEIYMTALQIYFQAIGRPQGGGWPLTMILTAEGLPVMGGTYFPPRDRDDATGLLTVLGLVQETWVNDPLRLETTGKQLANYVRESLEQRPQAMAALPAPESLAAIQAALAEQFDDQFGGFGYNPLEPRRPKFPEPANLLFLVDRFARTGDPQAGQMLEVTLDHLGRGGIRDHLGGGLHRYSTDRYWRIPHFEKMLYDQGQLTSVLARAVAVSRRGELRQMLDELVAFVLRDLTDPATGGFYSALDAETDGDEGAYYAWRRDEVFAALGPAAELFAAAYGLDDGPNFGDRYLLLLPQSTAALARRRGVPLARLEDDLAASRTRLAALRGQRPRPRVDTKIQTSWNGLMIRGLADAGRLLDRGDYVDAAARAASFALGHLRSDDGRLWHTYGAGQAKLPGYLDDYAFLVDGLVGLHLATGDERWLEAADELAALQVELFWDDESGGFYFTAKDHEELLARSKNIADSALPSGNAVSVSNLVYLSQALERRTYFDLAEQATLAFARTITELPAAVPRMGVALAELLEAGDRRRPAPPVHSAEAFP